MIRIFILLVTLFLLGVFVWELKRYFTRDEKEEELKETFIEGDLVDIDMEIAEEKARQKDVHSEMEELNSKNNIDTEEYNND